MWCVLTAGPFASRVPPVPSPCARLPWLMWRECAGAPGRWAFGFLPCSPSLSSLTEHFLPGFWEAGQCALVPQVWRCGLCALNAPPLSSASAWSRGLRCWAPAGPAVTSSHFCWFSPKRPEGALIPATLHPGCACSGGLCLAGAKLSSPRGGVVCPSVSPEVSLAVRCVCRCPEADPSGLGWAGVKAVNRKLDSAYFGPEGLRICSSREFPEMLLLQDSVYSLPQDG